MCGQLSPTARVRATLSEKGAEVPPDRANQNRPGRPFEQSCARDYRDLLALHPDNTFLVKAAYWWNR